MKRPLTVELPGLLMACFISVAVLAAAEEAPRTAVASQRVFSCGHSFHFHLPDMLAEMAGASGISGHEIAGASMIGGSNVLTQWDAPEEKSKAKTALQAGTVDVLTLTPIYLPDEGLEKFVKLGVETNPRLRVTLLEFWLPFDEYNRYYYEKPRQPWPKVVDHQAATVAKLKDIHQKYFDEMAEVVTTLNEQVGHQAVFVVPTGRAVIALREKIIAGQAPGLLSQEDLFKDPLGHPKPVLQVLDAYCHFAVIYRKSPVGQPAPAAFAKLKQSPGDKAALNLLLQEIAWDAAQAHPLSGVSTPPGL